MLAALVLVDISIFDFLSHLDELRFILNKDVRRIIIDHLVAERPISVTTVINLLDLAWQGRGLSRLRMLIVIYVILIQVLRRLGDESGHTLVRLEAVDRLLFRDEGWRGPFEYFHRTLSG